MLLTWLFHKLASREIHLFFNSCSIFHQLNTKPNTIKSHKIQWTKLKQLQHFLSWNKANIKHSCKLQLYIFNVQTILLTMTINEASTRTLWLNHYASLLWFYVKYISWRIRIILCTLFIFLFVVRSFVFFFFWIKKSEVTGVDSSTLRHIMAMHNTMCTIRALLELSLELLTK